ncbi:hypothetical protein BDQ17DRAFT_1419081 [Cyathus striatus]|nr:hypothetical protein BDQ17DRAFT_1419081 [Cyathus striatus]
MSRTETASYKRCHSRFRGFQLKRNVRSMKGSAVLKLKSPSPTPIRYDKKKKLNGILVSHMPSVREPTLSFVPARYYSSASKDSPLFSKELHILAVGTTGIVNNQSSDSRCNLPKSERTKQCLPGYLEEVAEKVLEASEIMQTQIYQRLAQFHIPIQHPERVQDRELPTGISNVNITTEQQELVDSSCVSTRGRNMSRKVIDRAILSQSQAVFFSTLARSIQNTVITVEGLLQEAYLDLRFIRQVITRKPEQDTSEKLEEELEVLLEKIHQFSISDPSRARRRTTLREHFQLSLDNIAEEIEEGE